MARSGSAQTFRMSTRSKLLIDNAPLAALLALCLLAITTSAAQAGCSNGDPSTSDGSSLDGSKGGKDSSTQTPNDSGYGYGYADE